jgi:hypothetical protein
MLDSKTYLLESATDDVNFCRSGYLLVQLQLQPSGLLRDQKTQGNSLL